MIIVLRSVATGREELRDPPSDPVVILHDARPIFFGTSEHKHSFRRGRSEKLQIKQGNCLPRRTLLQGLTAAGEWPCWGPLYW
jgi:hypothetical protein